jgi:hypothetical protein
MSTSAITVALEQPQSVESGTIRRKLAGTNPFIHCRYIRVTDFMEQRICGESDRWSYVK